VTWGLARKGGLAWLLAVLLLLLGGAVWFAEAGPTPSPASNRAAARLAAMRLLADVWLPTGATQVSGDPGASGWLRYSVGGAPATPDLFDFHRFWRLAGDPQTVIGWIEAHRPRGAKIFTIGTAGQYGKTVMWSVTFAFPVVPGRIAEEGLGVGVTAARGGGTALRADGVAVWLIPRPAGEVVPS
jgi:hypothetical protein